VTLVSRFSLKVNLHGFSFTPGFSPASEEAKVTGTVLTVFRASVGRRMHLGQKKQTVKTVQDLFRGGFHRLKARCE
jgi:hypothetical protein